MTQQWKQSNDEPADLAPEGGENPAESSGETGFSGEKKPRISTPTLILFGAFASALAILYLLGMQNKPRSVSADDKGSAIADLLGKPGNSERLTSLFVDTKNIVGLVYSLGKRDPNIPMLSHDPLGSRVVAPTREITSVIPTNTEEAEKMRLVAEMFKTLKLQSVMVSGKSSAAMINNRMLETGGKIGDLTVAGIEADRVLLSYGGHTFELKQTKPKEPTP